MICDDCLQDTADRWVTDDCPQSMDGEHHPARCLNENEDCNGPVELRWPGYGTRSWPRCEFHGEERIERHNDPNSVARYADSDCVPDWFDPAYAGERWEED